LFIAGLTALSFAIAAVLTALTTVLFMRIGGSRALALGVAAGSRNMGLMLAAAGSSVPELTWLYFAVAQFPIYLLPQVLKPLVARIEGLAAKKEPPPPRN
jgi:BASS family bile acid:Na+ symporter